MSESSFKDGDVVWVKWSSTWWPGEVWDSSRVPQEVLTSLRKPVSVFVKFFQEEEFEYVRNLGNIERYNCERKMEYIKKGMDKFKSNKRVMKNFPGDVVKAEEMTKGNINILKSFETPTKPKSAPTTPITSSAKSKTIETTTPVSKKQSGQYNSAEKVQTTSSPAPKSDKKQFSCTMCHYSTDRMNLLMFHIKNHSSTFVTKVHEPPSSTNKKSSSKSPTKKSTIAEDTIADDVRKIKESMKIEEKKSTTTTKKFDEKKTTTTTTTTGRGRWSKKVDEKKTIIDTKNKIETESTTKVKEEQVNTLKNELLADWSDDEDDDLITTSNKKSEENIPTTIEQQQQQQVEIDDKSNKLSSRSIRNIPKKQRISEVYVKPEPQPDKEKSLIEDELNDEDEITSTTGTTTTTISKKSTRNNNRRSNKSTSKIEDDNVDDKVESNDDHHLLATANELLNETEVPKVDDANNKQSSTFHNPKSNDIEKRNLPPKERNKRIFRANESSSPNNNGTTKECIESDSATINELMLPHKKKQSSRLLSEKSSSLSPTTTTITTTEVVTTTRRKRKSENVESTTIDNVDIEMKVDVNVNEKMSPLREDESSSPERRGQKRKNSISIDDSQPNNNEDEPKLKKIHHTNENEVDGIQIDESPIKPTTIKIPRQALKISPDKLVEMKKQGFVTVGSNRKNKFTEKGKQIYNDIQLKEKEKLEKTVVESSSVVVVDEIKINEVEDVAKEEISIQEDVEMKEQQTTPNDSHNNITTTDDVQQSPKQQQQDDIKVEDKVEEKTTEKCEKIESEVTKIEVSNEIDDIKSDIDTQETLEADEKPTIEEVVEKDNEEILNNNSGEEKTTSKDDEQQQQQQVDEETGPIENGREAENGDGAGLIALQAESFGGPPNCFYLCRNIDDRYVPVDNQILVLNAQNALVPYEGDIITDEAIQPTEAANESLTVFPQLSPNSNIIISTPNGQKIELNSSAILALQEQADENGMASIDFSGEQMELNIHAILEAINSNQENVDNDVIPPNALLIENDAIVDTDNIPAEIHHSATQVSETLTKPIMSTTVAPEIVTTIKPAITDVVNKSLNIEDSLASIGVTTPQRANVPKSLELPITVTNSTIAETVNHRKLANATSVISDIIEVVPEVVQTVTDITEVKGTDE